MPLAPATKEKIQAALEAAFRAIAPCANGPVTARLVGFWREFMALVEKYSVAPEELMAAGVAAGVLLSLCSLEDEPSPAQLRQILRDIRAIPSQLRGPLKAQLKNLPRKAGGGRHKKLALEEERQACGQVGALLATGARLPDAFQQVARQFTRKGRIVSARTIKRTWEKRDQINKA